MGVAWQMGSPKKRPLARSKYLFQEIFPAGARLLSDLDRSKVVELNKGCNPELNSLKGAHADNEMCTLLLSCDASWKLAWSLILKRTTMYARTVLR